MEDFKKAKIFSRLNECLSDLGFSEDEKFKVRTYLKNFEKINRIIPNSYVKYGKQIEAILWNGENLENIHDFLGFPVKEDCGTLCLMDKHKVVARYPRNSYIIKEVTSSGDNISYTPQRDFEANYIHI